MERRAPALSPSRINDFRQCRLLFRLRAVERLPEPLSPAAELGTLVHAVLEALYDLPAAVRTEPEAHALLAPTWALLKEASSARASLHASPEAESVWLADAAGRVSTYFTLENPMRLEPDAREALLEWQMPDGPLLRGIIDRVDVAPDGAIRVVDYKTGKTPAPQYGGDAKFQMRFYALLLHRVRGRAPSLLRLLYLRDGGVTELRPTAEDLEAVEFAVRETWAEIGDATARGDWRPRRSQLCGWCSFQALCPEFGGTPPPVSPEVAAEALGVTLTGDATT